MQTIYRTKAIRLDSGERFPLLVECDTELPVLDVVDFSLAYHRTKSINSSKSRVGAIGLFLEWAEACLIDIGERFGSGDLFSQAEIESLATALGQSKRKKVTVGDQVLPGNVLGDTQANRVDWVTEYIRWRGTGVAQAMKITDPRVLAINQRLEQIEKQLKALKRKGAGKVRLGLTEEQQVRLFEIVRPDSPENPFYAETRYRNFMLFLLFYELGIRRAESLVLKANHVHLHQNPRITIAPNPGDPSDPRKDQPLVKTAGRTLPISTLLAQTIHMGMTSHQFRHWLNTLAQAGGLDQALVARWSGRDDIQQNSEYDHLTGLEIAERFRGMMDEGKIQGALADLHDRKEPADRASFRDSVLATAHVTDIGLCDLDWISSPCPEFQACETCEFCLVEKGNEDGKLRTEQRLADNRWLLERVQAEVDDDTIGASNHLNAIQQSIAGCERILAVHQDPDIPDGTLVQPTTASPRHFDGPGLEDTV